MRSFRNLWLLATNHRVCWNSKGFQTSAGKWCIEQSGNTMVKVLNVAEKNDAAKNIANILSRGASQMSNGISKYNKIYSFDYMLNRQKVRMVMTSVSGHLLTYDFAGSYRSWNKCKPEALFKAPVEKKCLDMCVDIMKTLEREAATARRLIIWTDCDREGENIAFQIIQVCKDVNPSIEVQRAKFSEITNRSIMHAISSLCSPDINVSNAVDVRQQLDLRIGAAFTRFLTMRLTKVFPEHLVNKLISYGSCQFPTLGFVVERYKQVQSFVPEPFWKIKVDHEQNDTFIEFSWKRGRLFSMSTCFVIYEKCLDSPQARVIDVVSKPKSKWRPQPLDTIELEKLSSKKLKINAKETMKIAEKLYTKGFISYPRTETNIFPKDLDLTRLVQQQTESSQWGDFAQSILHNGVNPRNGNKSDKAHPPIHPTKFTDSLQGDDKKVYDFIVRHFLACCSKDAVGQETSVIIEISDEQFSANGLMILERNYLNVYPYDRWNAKVIPVYSRNQLFTPTQIQMVDGETSAPPLLTESDLIALMDKHGIGTDATHADHIETIKSRMYVGVRDDGRFVPGQLGMGLVEGYDLMGFQMSKPHLRSELEADLKRICEGSKLPKEVLDEQIGIYSHVFSESLQHAGKLDESLGKYLGSPVAIAYTDVSSNENQVVRTCYLCSSDMTLRRKRQGDGFYIGCMAYPKCQAKPIWLPSYVEDVSVTDSNCPECDPGPVKLLQFKFKAGSMSPYFPDQYTGCIGGCDHMFLESLGIIASARSLRSADLSTSSVLSISNNQSRSSRSFSTDSGYNSFQSTVSIRTNNSDIFITASNVRPSATRSQPRPAQSSSVMQTGNGATPTLVCHCGQDAKLLTVHKPTVNNGRQFYKCAKQADACEFFQWADARESDAKSDGGAGPVKCKCRLPATIRMVNKANANNGRTFYSCSKQKKDRPCNFFEWVEDDNNASEGNTSTKRKQPQIGPPKRRR